MSIYIRTVGVSKASLFDQPVGYIFQALKWSFWYMWYMLIILYGFSDTVQYKAIRLNQTTQISLIYCNTSWCENKTDTHVLEKSSFICIFNTLYSTEQRKKKNILVYIYLYIYLFFIYSCLLIKCILFTKWQLSSLRGKPFIKII